MPKLSPAYREDEPTPLPNELTEFLDTNFLKKLDNFKVSNPKILVVFSGGNAIGKSTISRLISSELKALVIENDAVKNCLLEFDPNISRNDLNKLTWSYTINLYKRLDQITNNGFVVRDGVIDWYFDRILPIFEARGYKLFVIAFDVTSERQLELLNTRGDKPTVSVERLREITDDHKIHMSRFRQNYDSDITLADRNLFEHHLVIDELRKRFKL